VVRVGGGVEVSGGEGGGKGEGEEGEEEAAGEGVEVVMGMGDPQASASMPSTQPSSPSRFKIICAAETWMQADKRAHARPQKEE
jgi:hypothetical protein